MGGLLQATGGITSSSTTSAPRVWRDFRTYRAGIQSAELLTDDGAISLSPRGGRHGGRCALETELTTLGTSPRR